MATKAEKLKDIRRKSGLNQTDFGATLGIKQAHYSALERGKRDVSTKILKKLIQKYNISPEWWHDESTTNIADSNKDRPQSVPFSAKNAQNDVYDYREVLPTLMNDIIREKLFYIDFFLKAICFHLSDKSDQANDNTKSLNKTIEYINTLIINNNGEFGSDQEPSYHSLNLLEKTSLIKDLDRNTRGILENIWKHTRDIKEIKV